MILVKDYEYIAEIDSIEEIIWITDVLLFVIDDFSEFVSIIIFSCDFEIFILKYNDEITFFVSIFLFIVFFDSNVNNEMNISNLFCKKNDFKNFIILKFLDSSMSWDRCFSISFVSISDWDLFFLFFFFDLILNLLNFFQIFFSFNNAFDVCFSFFVIILDQQSHFTYRVVDCYLISRCQFEIQRFIILFFVTVLRDFCFLLYRSWLSLTSNNRELILTEEINDLNFFMSLT